MSCSPQASLWPLCTPWRWPTPSRPPRAGRRPPPPAWWRPSAAPPAPAPASCSRGVGLAVASLVAYRVLYSEVVMAAAMLNPLKGGDETKGTVGALVAAQVAMLVLKAVTHPLETLGRRVQVQIGKKGGDRVYFGTLDCASKTFAEEGIAGFYKGFWASSLKTVGTAVMLVVVSKNQGRSPR
mmetsp:Transcript_132646/g.301478  ORF Transcript_132646/g.301478 Transcript_132646/m.301478 type:complete len:182 (+) Transcript_132646:349-894(+)